MRGLVKITMAVCIMTWKEAKQEIKKHVEVGTDVNTVTSKGAKKSHGRIVKRVCDWGYIIPQAKNRDMEVTWDMLEKCWNGMVDNRGVYDIKALKRHYPKSPGCYVQTIHMIFEKAGLT